MDDILKNFKKIDLEVIPLCYNEILLEVCNNPDEFIYSLDDLNYNIKNNIFSDVVMDNLATNLLINNVNISSDFFKFDAYAHLEDINYIDVVNNINDILNYCDESDIIKINEILEVYL